MPFTSLGFLIVVVLVSGGIAVLADWLGRKVGKKKLTYRTRFFHMRPKTTAQVSTFLSGIIVSGVTILLVNLIFSDVRQWIAEGPSALKRLQQVEARTKELDAEIASKTNDLEKMQEQDVKQRAELARLTTEGTKRKNDLLKAEQLLSAAQASYKKVQGQLAPLRKNLETARLELRQARANVKSAQNDLKQAQVRLANVRQQYALSQSSYEEAARQVKDAIDRLTEVEQREIQLEKQVRELEGESQRLAEQREQAEQELTEAQRKVAEERMNLISASIDLQRMQNELKETQLAVVRAGSAVATSRFQPMMFSIGEEIIREAVPADTDVEGAVKAIRQLVRRAQTIAIDKGAEARGPFPAAGIFEREDPVTKRVYSSEELIQQLAEQIAGKDDEQLLIAVSTLNAFRGEPVSLEIAVTSNPVVYRESELIAEGRIDGNKDDASILNQITDFVSGTVKTKARQDNMVPKRGSDEAFGSVSISELYLLVSRIRDMGRTVRLQALALKETRAGDPLALDFRLK